MPFAWSLVPQPVRRFIAPVEPRPTASAPSIATPLAADAPLPLDDELPQAHGGPMGQRRRRLLWAIALLALALRALLLPFGHQWDLTVDYNFFIDLAHNRSPYDTFVALSHVARSAGWDTVYEYYAYPPAPFYIYWPLAHIFALLHPSATYYVALPNTPSTPILPLSFDLLFKLPIWAADLGIATLLMRMTGTARGFRDYLLNPYVLLISGAWTFDAIMVLGMVAAVYFVSRGRLGWAGVALAFGAMVKFIPALIAPTIVLYLIKKQRPFREIVTFVVAFTVACVVLIGPFWKGLLEVVSFHAGRVGGGMTWVGIFASSLPFNIMNPQYKPMLTTVSAFGDPLLLIMLLLGYWWIFIKDMSLSHMTLLTLCAFFVGSKLVNEQYALSAIPFVWLASYRAGGVWRWFYRLFWIVPLSFTIMHVPIDHFFYVAYHTILGHRADSVNWTGATGLDYPVIPWHSGLLDQPLVVALGLCFFTLSLVTLLWRPPRYVYAYAAPVTTRPESPTPEPPERGPLSFFAPSDESEASAEAQEVASEAEDTAREPATAPAGAQGSHPLRARAPQRGVRRASRATSARPHMPASGAQPATQAPSSTGR